MKAKGLMTVTKIPGAYSYIVYKGSDGKYYVKNGLTGQVEYSSGDAADAIQWAINSLPSGGKIFIKSGTYYIKRQIVLNSNIAIVGEGKSTVFVNAVSRPASLGSFLYAEDKQDILIEGIYFDGNLRNLGTTGGAFEGAIILAGVRYAIIRGCAFYDTYSNPIGIHHTANNRPEFIIVEDNEFYGHNGDAIIQVKYGIRIIIIGNRSEKGQGIFLRDGTENSVVAYNVIRPNSPPTNVDGGPMGGDGIKLFSSIRNVIIGNTIYECKIGSDGYGGVGINLNVSDLNVIEGNIIFLCDASAILIINSNQNAVIGNILMNNCRNTSAQYRDEMDIIGSTQTIGNNIRNNIVIETGGQTARYGLFIDSFQNETIVVENSIYYIAPAIVNQGANSIIRRNRGYPTEASGVATLPAGATSVTVNHGLVGAPSKVLITPLGQPPGSLWVGNITATSFTIYSSVAPTANLQIAWYAEL